MSKAKLGLLPRDIDTSLLQDSSLVEFCYLVEAHSEEERWTRAFIKDKSRIIPYSLNTPTNAASKGLEDIFLKSDIGEKLKANNISHVYITKVNKALNDWAVANDITFVVTPYDSRKQLENKIWFNTFLNEMEIPQPPSRVMSIAELEATPVEKKIVIQTTDSAGGEGTFFAENDAEKKTIVTTLLNELHLTQQTQVLVREFIQGVAYGQSTVVFPQYIAISNVRLQCYDRQAMLGQDILAGTSWVDTLSPIARKRIFEIIEKMCVELHKRGHFGTFNFDMMLTDDDQVFILECNARYAASTFHTLLYPEMMGGKDTNELFVEHYFNRQPVSDQVKVFNGVTFDYIGSTIMVNYYPSKEQPELTVTRRMSNGIYILADKGLEFVSANLAEYTKYRDEPMVIYYSDAAVGEVYNSYTTLAWIAANFPLFDTEGTLNSSGQLIRTFFRFA